MRSSDTASNLSTPCTHNPLGVNLFRALHITVIDQEDMDSRNLIGGEQKFVYWAYVLVVNNRRTMASKIYTWQHFL